jgi:serine protease DegQ
MRRFWLIFSQTVTVCLAILFVVVTLRPQWLANKLAAQTSEVSRLTAPGSYSEAVAHAAPAVVNIYTTKKVSVSP